MEQVPTFIKSLKEFFWDIRTKEKDGGRVYTKMLIMHDVDLGELIEMTKEEMSEIKLFIKKQKVSHYEIETIGWCIKLYLKIDLQ